MNNGGKKPWNKNKKRFNNNKQRFNNNDNHKKEPSERFSASFIQFYKSILIPDQMNEEEFNEMLDFYRHPLYHVFRLSQLAPDHDRLENELNSLFTELQEKIAIEEKEGSSTSTAKLDCVEYKYFPSKYGRVFKVAVEKEKIRKLPEFEKFNAWLRFNTDVGNCHRQEFVSMIPPIFMDIKPNSSVLDTCAAPGSKTGQIMEMLSSESNIIPIEGLGENDRKYGFVIANDSNAKRCHDLVHQIQRIGTHNVIITCQNGAKCEFGFDQFDRVLCDVPCTCDGTIRKNPDTGSKWSMKESVNIHRTQKEILLRGLELLKKDGICVYSTCSMNPIENEAVVSEVVSDLGNENVEIVDCAALYPDLKRHPGLTKWSQIVELWEKEHNSKVESSEENKKQSEKAEENANEKANENTNEKAGENANENKDEKAGENANENKEEKTDEKTEENAAVANSDNNEIVKRGIHTEAQCPGMERCMRFYPQDHDSGGFFVCILHKTGSFERKSEPKPAKELKEAAYNPLEKVSPKHLDEIIEAYGIRKNGDIEATDGITVNRDQFFVRDEAKVNKVYYMSQPIADLINKYGSESLHTVSAGVQVFNFKNRNRHLKDAPELPYVSQEGIKIAFQMATQRKYALTPDEMKLLLEAGANGVKLSQFDPERRKIFLNKPRNCAIFYVEDTKFMYSGHLDKYSLVIYLKKELINSELRQLMGQFPDLQEEYDDDDDNPGDNDQKKKKD